MSCESMTGTSPYHVASDARYPRNVPRYLVIENNQLSKGF